MPSNKKTKTYSKLAKNLSADVVIIGGGLAGISAAYFLAKAGKKVIVLEAKELGVGATSKTTAFVTNILDTSLTDLAHMFGPVKAKLAWQSHITAISAIEKVIKAEKIACSFMRCSSYYYANNEKEFTELQQEHKTAKKFGFKTKLHASSKLPFVNFGCLEIFNQAKFDAGEYLKKLAQAATKYGVKIFEHTAVQKIRNDNESLCVVVNSNISVTAKNVITATYYPFNNPKTLLFKKGMYVSYVLELQIPKGQFIEAIYEDCANPYNYFRVDGGEKFDTMLIGGQDHRAEIKMDPKKNYKAIQEYARKTFPKLKYRILSHWNGPILEPSDGLALIGEVAPHQFVTTAFSGNGMTYSVISALLLRDQIVKKKNPWQGLYNPNRIPSIKQLWQKGKDYTEELVKGAIKNTFRK